MPIHARRPALIALLAVGLIGGTTSASVLHPGTRGGRPGKRVTAAAADAVTPAQRTATLTAVLAPDAGGTPPRTTWDRLADCESGDWRDGAPKRGTARWDYGLTFSHGDIFQGGLNFHPRTWDAYRDPRMPGHAGRATRAQQIEVAERVLADQGWGAWPVCSRKMGLR